MSSFDGILFEAGLLESCLPLGQPRAILIIRRGDTGFLLKNSAEIGLAGKTNFQGYLRYGHAAHFQQMLGLLNAITAQIGHWSDANFFVEAARKILLIDR